MYHREQSRIAMKIGDLQKFLLFKLLVPIPLVQTIKSSERKNGMHDLKLNWFLYTI